MALAGQCRHQGDEGLDRVGRAVRLDLVLDLDGLGGRDVLFGVDVHVAGHDLASAHNVVQGGAGLGLEEADEARGQVPCLGPRPPVG